MIRYSQPNLEELTTFKIYLENLVRRLEVSSKKSSLSISERSDGEYYSVKDDEGKRHYLSKKNTNILRAALQNDYDYKLLKIAIRELSVLDRFLRRTNLHSLEELYSCASNERKQLIKPLFVSNEDYSKAWQAKPYKMHPEAPNDNFITSRNEKVRSKSEVIIADTLNSMDIPYKYERELVLEDGSTIYPDFTLLNVRTREEIIYEHFGKMDDEAYLTRTLAKLNIYAKNGFTLGKNLIATFESSTSALNRTTLIRTIENALN